MFNVYYIFSDTDSGILTVRESELSATIYDIISKCRENRKVLAY